MKKYALLISIYMQHLCTSEIYSYLFIKILLDLRVEFSKLRISKKILVFSLCVIHEEMFVCSTYLNKYLIMTMKQIL